MLRCGFYFLCACADKDFIKVLVVDLCCESFVTHGGFLSYFGCLRYFLFLMMFDVKFYFHSVLLSRASGISGVYICVVIAL